MSTAPKFGLVMSGGGAKGAFQVGAIKALAELGVQVEGIAGASIGALNGAIVASAPSLAVAAERLDEVWKTLAHLELFKVHPKFPAYLALLAGSGLALKGSAFNSTLLRLLAIDSTLPGSTKGSAGALSTGPLQTLLDKYLDSESLNTGLPLYVSAYQDRGAESLMQVILAELGFRENPDSEFFHVQSFRPEEQKALLLASAAIPLLFETQEINGKHYSDGGQGGWQRVQGNTPITPLIDAGYSHIIVTHLIDGSLWSRRNFPDTTIIEIRPRGQLSDSMLDIVGFHPDKIEAWIQKGYDDTHACWERIRKSIESVNNLRSSVNSLAVSEETYGALEMETDAAMSRIRGS